MPGPAPTAPVDLDESSFASFTKAHGVVVVDCWAPWCGPCKRIEPIVKELAAEYDGKVAFGKLNTDEHGGVAARYGIMSIPTLLVFRGGERVDQIVGLMPKEQLRARIDKHLA